MDEDLYLPRGLYSSNITLPIIFDSGCSVSVSPCREDFGDTLVPSTKSMLGLGATVQVKGEGMVKWEFRDDYGVKQVIEVKGYYIPTSKVRLFSPQSYFKQEKGGATL